VLIRGAINTIVPVVDWRTKADVSPGFLYLFPIISVWAFVSSWVVVVPAIGCAILAEFFSTVGERGFLELGNRPAIELMAPRDGSLIVARMAAFLTDLHYALHREVTEEAEAGTPTFSVSNDRWPCCVRSLSRGSNV